MGFESFLVILDNPTSAFIVGKEEPILVTGRVVLVAKKSQNVKGVKLNFKGNAKVQWTQHSDKTATTYTSGEDYISKTIYLAGDGKVKLMLTGGEQCYPFRLTLPASIPSSCKEVHGRISYKVEAVVERAWKFDIKAEKYLTVVAPVELNTTFEFMSPVNESSVEYYGLLSSPLALTLVLKLKTRNIVPGEKFPITVDVQNDSNVEVHEVIGEVKKYTTFRQTPPKKETIVTKSVLCTFKLEAPEKKGFKSSTVDLPPLNETALNLDGCQVMDVAYALTITAVTLGLHKDAKLKCRVNIVT